MVELLSASAAASAAASVTTGTAAARAAIVVPSPNVAEDHQTKNALAYEKEGAVILLREKELSAEVIVSLVSELRRSPAKRHRLAQNACRLAPRGLEEALWRAIDHFKIPYQKP